MRIAADFRWCFFLFLSAQKKKTGRYRYFCVVLSFRSTYYSCATALSQTFASSTFSSKDMTCIAVVAAAFLPHYLPLSFSLPHACAFTFRQLFDTLLFSKAPLAALKVFFFFLISNGDVSSTAVYIAHGTCLSSLFLRIPPPPTTVRLT